MCLISIKNIKGKILFLCETLCFLCDSLWYSYYTKLLREAQSYTKNRFFFKEALFIGLRYTD